MNNLTYQEQLSIALKRVAENRKNRIVEVEQLPIIEKDNYAEIINSISMRLK